MTRQNGWNKESSPLLTKKLVEKLRNTDTCPHGNELVRRSPSGTPQNKDCVCSASQSRARNMWLSVFTSVPGSSRHIGRQTALPTPVLLPVPTKLVRDQGRMFKKSSLSPPINSITLQRQQNAGNDTRNVDFTRVGQCGAQGFESASRSGEDRSPVAAGRPG
jgi:hypothetical protein